MEHPADDVLFRFVLAATDREESRQVVRHLLAQCPACAAALRRMRKEPPPDPPPGPGAYDQAIERLTEQLLDWTAPQKPAPPQPKRGNLLSYRPLRWWQAPDAGPDAGEGGHRHDSATSNNGTPRRGSG